MRVTFQPKGSPEFMAAVGKIFERQRKLKGLLQKDVAAVAGVRPETISYYESGTVTPGLSVFLRLMYLLDLRSEELMACLKHDYKPKRLPKLAAGSTPLDS